MLPSVPLLNGSAAPGGPTSAEVQPALMKNRGEGVVKQVLSGDQVVIRGQPRGGPPPEVTLCLTNIQAPKLARRPANDGTPATNDEPYAYESREFLRSLLLGKQVTYVTDDRNDSTALRKYGTVYLGNDTSGQSVTEMLVSQGLAEVRGNRPPEELAELQNAAKAQGLGKWGPPEELAQHVRSITWAVENPRNLVDSLKQRPQKAIIDYVRDGSTVHAFLLPDFIRITLQISGIKCPTIRLGERGQTTEDSEPFAEQARFFTEVRLLQRDVEVVLEGVSNNNFIGSILHPNGDIAELLLKEGFARCVDWSLVLATGGVEKLRGAEKLAKDQKLRIWKSYEPGVMVDKKSFTAKVSEVINGDALMVKKDSGEYVKIFLSSIRPPRMEDSSQGKENQPVGRNFKPLYDVPYMFEAREFLRKRLIGKKVQVTVDYVQPTNNQYPEKIQCSVSMGNQNIAEALVAKGLATVVRYKQGDDNRSGQYDMLLAAEAKAEKSRKGIHATKGGSSTDKVPVVRVQELQGDHTKSKQFLPYLQRAGRSEGIVEFVASGSRVRVFVPKETCLMTFLLSGISCPRASRMGPGGVLMEGEPFGEEALKFTKDRCLQHEVEIEVETMDKAGNFVGYLFIGGVNMSQQLVEQGLASVHFTAERSKYYPQLKQAEEAAQEKGIKIWEDYKEQESRLLKEERQAEVGERTLKYNPVAVTEVLPNLHVFVQYVTDGPRLETMMENIQKEMAANPPLSGAYTPRKGDFCFAKFTVDNLWYRARVENAKSRDSVDVLYVDFGNRESLDASRLAGMPDSTYTPADHAQYPKGAYEYALALIQPPEDPEYLQAAVEFLSFETMGTQGQYEINIEYSVGGQKYITLVRKTAGGSGEAGESIDIGNILIENGLALAEPRKERRLTQLLTEYKESESKAKKKHVNMWQYGDFTGHEL